MTEPTALSQLRHLYQNMVNGAVRDTASAKRIAEGLLAPAIAALERGTPQPTQAQAGAVPLTDEQIVGVMHSIPINAAPSYHIAFARAIEAAHGIGIKKGDGHA